MSEELTARSADETLAELAEMSLMPTAEEISVLRPIERTGFKLVRAMNFGLWKRFWTFCQRHIGSLWIFLATYNLMNVFGIENVENSDPNRPVILVANHRSFFDMYTVSSVMFRRTTRPITLFFPVRARFFYDSPIGWFVNLVMGWWSMYPPFFREEGEGEKRRFDKFSVRELIRISSKGEGHIIGFHPEGKRNLNDDPYSFLPAQPGIGKVILNADPQVIPVFIAGLGNDLPKQILGNWTGGEKVRIWFGEIIDLSEFHGKRDSLRTHKEISDFLMTKIADLGEKDREWMRS
ncbi:MAG: 1-acyl-sn-glycerol-3-phosphate acyltransferase [Pyrinomonadaceae bacterium]|nr:1-acyl-sn-glycerol-3-phosphate acyltransferase [Blastocatellia bacterium]MCW5957650.1 1-acyl-sn-glycerol-3-phosphate acyltransferase [Pyrinomonadaceae bacterium]